MFKANVTMLISNIPAKTHEEAKEWLKQYFQELAESNDCSEFLANIMRKGIHNIDVDIYEEGELR